MELRRFGGQANHWKELGTLSKSESVGGLWFHAASVGELEALWPVILEMSQKNRKIIISIFSPSAESSLKKLVQELTARSTASHSGIPLSLDWGYSPWEGEWGEYLLRNKPTAFITHKYEAWPDLWMSLTELQVPLVIVGARIRGSLKFAKRICLFFVGRLPRLLFLPFHPSHAQRLAVCFSQAQTLVVPDPRWERVLDRASLGNSRSQELIRTLTGPRVSQDTKQNATKQNGKIRGIIGSAWLEDLKFLSSILTQAQSPIWIVPHRVDAASVSELIVFLQSLGIRPVQTSATKKMNSSESRETPSFVVVDELGVLAELYCEAEWVYVGGGFGSGVHSTIEPAIHGLPIAVGPNGVGKFYEIEELTESGQVTVVSQSEDLNRWFERVQKGEFLKYRTLWKESAQGHAGASQKISEAVENFK